MLKRLMRDYSRVAVLSHFTVLAIVYASIFSVVSSMDVQYGTPAPPQTLNPNDPKP